MFAESTRLIRFKKKKEHIVKNREQAIISPADLNISEVDRDTLYIHDIYMPPPAITHAERIKVIFRIF